MQTFEEAFERVQLLVVRDFLKLYENVRTTENNRTDVRGRTLRAVSKLLATQDRFLLVVDDLDTLGVQCLLQVLQLDLCSVLAQVALQLNLRTLPCCKGARKVVLCSAHCRARHCRSV